MKHIFRMYSQETEAYYLKALKIEKYMRKWRFYDMYENIKYNLKSDYPIAIYPKKVGNYAALTKIGGGYFWVEVLEYRVWLHPEMGAEDIYDGDDYFYSFPTFESALDFKNKNKGTERPLVLILQKE